MGIHPWPDLQGDGESHVTERTDFKALGRFHHTKLSRLVNQTISSSGSGCCDA